MNDPRNPTPSFEEFVDAHSDAIRSYLERMVGNPFDAADLLQETLIKIAKGLPGFEARSTVKTWAFSIAHRVVLDHFRKRSSLQHFVEFSEEDHPAEDRDLDEVIIIDEMNSCVRDVIDSLPPDYRAAIVLHDLQKLTAKETAKVTGCSLATAKIRIHRARKRLGQALENQCQFYRDRDQVLRCDRKGKAEP